MDFRRLRIWFLLLGLFFMLAISLYLTNGSRKFYAHNLAAEKQYVRIIESVSEKERVRAELERAGFHTSLWGREPDIYYAVYRGRYSFFDEISDQYYMMTDRGSRRLVGLVFFDGDEQVTSYTRSSKPPLRL